MMIVKFYRTNIDKQELLGVVTYNNNNNIVVCDNSVVGYILEAFDVSSIDDVNNLEKSIIRTKLLNLNELYDGTYVRAEVKASIYKSTIRLKGGPGSGHYGHAGRPGKVGGSVSGNVAVSLRTGKAAAIRRGWKSKDKKAGYKVGDVVYAIDKYGVTHKGTIVEIGDAYSANKKGEYQVKPEKGRRFWVNPRHISTQQQDIKPKESSKAPESSKVTETVESASKSPPTNSNFNSSKTSVNIHDTRDNVVVVKAIKNLPQEHLNMVNSITTGYVQSSNNAAGLCNSKSSIKMCDHTGGYRLWDRGAVRHEIAHAIDFHTNKYAGYDSIRKGIDAIHKIYGDISKNKYGSRSSANAEFRKNPTAAAPSGYPTRYAMFSNMEFFAESYKLYVQSPKMLQKRCPEVYEIMRDDVFNGVEYMK